MNKVISKALCLMLSLTILMGSVSDIFAESYNDVSQNDWYYNSVEYITNMGLMNGTGDSIFSPKKSVSRGMLITILYRLEDSPIVAPSTVFFDVSPDAYYRDAISWAIQNNLVSGISKGQFSPDTSITKEQIATVLYRYSQFKGYDTSITKPLDEFSDTSNVSNYATMAIQWTLGNKIIQGSYNKLNPSEIVTRAQVSVMLVRFIESVRKLEKGKTTQSNSNIGQKIIVTVDSKNFSVTLEDNDTTKSFIKQLPLTLDMSELNGNEKYYYLSNKLPTASEQLGEIHAGDIMLYGDDCLVVFYKTFSSSYRYTRLGYIEDAVSFAQVVGNGNIKVTFDLAKDE